MKFELICEGTREAIQIREQRSLSDVHPVEFAHSFIPNFGRWNDELDQGLPRIRIFPENFFDRFMQIRRYQKSSRLRNEATVHRMRLSQPDKRTGSGQKMLPEITRGLESNLFL